eukprot:3941023-Rhodomonas_salina.1
MLEVFWHSSAHILGQALEVEHHALLVHGPALETGGFFYDACTGSNTISEQDAKRIEARMQRITKEKQTFERLVLTKAEAQAMFSYNPFKLDIIAQKVPDNQTCTAYRCGPLIDLCRGPHLPHTGCVKAFEVTKNAAAYWKGQASNPVSLSLSLSPSLPPSLSLALSLSLSLSLCFSLFLARSLSCSLTLFLTLARSLSLPPSLQLFLTLALSLAPSPPSLTHSLTLAFARSLPHSRTRIKAGRDHG